MKNSRKRALIAAVALTAAMGMGFSVGAETLRANSGDTITRTGTELSYSGTYPVLAVGFTTDPSQKAGKITIGDANTKSVTINGEGDGTLAVWAQRDASRKQKDNSTGKETTTQNVSNSGGKITINGDKLTINAHGSDGAYGIWAQNGTDQKSGDPDAATITINSKDTIINAKTDNVTLDEGEYQAIGIVAYSGSTVNVNGNLSVNPDAADPYKVTAISTRGNATININQDGTHTVKMKGNINFDSGESRPSSGGVSDATVNINLDGADSSWTGNTLLSGKATKATDKFSKYMTLRVANGATWTASGEVPDSTIDGAKANVINNLIVDNGTVDTGKVLTVMNSLDASNNASVKAGEVNIGAVLPDGNNSEATANIGLGTTLTADTLTVNAQSKLKSAEGSTVNAKKLAVKGTGTVELEGTTNITDELSSDPGSTVNITNLATAPKKSNLAGETHYNLGANNWNAPQSYNAQKLIVDPSGMNVTSTEGLRGGKTTRKTVIFNNATKQDGDSAAQTPNATSLTNNTPKQMNIGTTLQGTGEAELDGNNVLYKVDVSNNAQPQTHNAVMAQDASVTTVTGGFDFLAQAMDGMTESGVYGIASVGGGEHKYDTGSHIKTNAWHAVAGIGVKNAAESGSSTEYGAFYDYGDGHYRTFSDGRGDGKTIYKGAGLFGKYTFDNQIYVEGSFRAGHVKNTASDIFHDALGNKYGLKLSSNYNAFHVGIGKVLDVGGDDTLDVYGKFFHTHIGSDSFEAGGHYDIDSVDSNILRVGTRWNHKAGAWTHYLGVAYEYEFDGEAKGTADGAHIESADIGGSSVRFELGTKVETGKWVIGFNADAYAGQHKGYDGTISAGLKF